ncbi:MAG: beta-lactamase family protein [Burkholderiaceae bacterium]|nr:beta-lactamase family protein [Burkholderiaceae bacterium]
MPETTGFSVERLDLIARHLESNYIAPGRLPCAQMSVSRHGKTVWNCTLGKADLERDRPLADDAIFRIYSMTKPLTSVAFMMLVERGIVALDHPVDRYIPDWKKLGVYAGGTYGQFRTTAPTRPMQIVDLLRHTSGLTYGFQQRTNVDAAYREAQIDMGGKSRSLDEKIALLAEMPLEFSPGSAWNYSVSTDVLGYLIGRLSGESFESFLHNELLAPLGMVDTGFHVPPEKASRLAACYTATPEGGMKLLDDPERSRLLRPATYFSGGGGLVSTLADYNRFCRMLMAGGTLDGRRYIGRKTLELMGANHLPGGVFLPAVSVSMFAESTYDGVGFGLGFSVVEKPALTLIPGSVGELAWGGMASTAFWLDPREDLWVVFMTQLTPSSTYPIRRELRTLVYSALND